MSKIGRNDPCPCGSGKKHKKCCEDRRRSDSNQANPSPDLENPVMLMVETQDGVFTRQIPAAMPLRLTSTQGKAAEEATHSAAAVWGLPDFMFRPLVRDVGSGTRELGDGTLVVGNLGLVLQVKSRGVVGESQEREENWIRKASRRALSQAKGTIRYLKKSTTTMVNLRDREVEIAGDSLDWMSVVIIDHDSPPGLTPVTAEEIEAGVVLLRRDWEFLFDQLKSSHAVAGYLRRVAGEPWELGAEAVRYHQLALADADGAPSALDPGLLKLGAPSYWEPMLPLAPAASSNEMHYRFYRTVLEDVASIDLQNTTEDVRNRALAELDRLPTEHRGHIGGFLGAALAEASGPNWPSDAFRFKRVAGTISACQLAFGAGPAREDYQQAFQTWTELRHYEHQERSESDAEEAASVGVLLTPRSDERRWDTTLTAIFGPTKISAKRLALLRDVWGDERSAMIDAGTAPDLRLAG